MKKEKITTLIIIGMLIPAFSQAQTFSGEIHSLQSVLDQLYDDMIPLCHQLIGIGRGLAAFAALWYIASRVWRSLANAESIDFYPLLRPFAIGIAILLFPYVLAMMNGVLKPTVTGTAAMVENANNAIAYLLTKKEEAIKKTTTWQLYGEDATHADWYRYTHPDGEEEGGVDMITNGMKFLMAKTAYSIRNALKQWMSEILHILFEAVALCINTIRTFYLIVLAILGPIVFGLSVFDGLHHTLTVWIARYINVFLWLPVANIFGSIIARIQENMLRIDIEQIEQYGDTFFSAADSAYIIFLIIGIVGYFTVPSVANYIVHAGGTNALLHKATNVFAGTTRAAMARVAPGASAAAHATFGMFQSSPQENKQGHQHKEPNTANTANQHQQNKIEGK